jgi:signal transduction histidine kinase
MLRDGALYQVVITPVYVHSGQGPELLNVLVAGFQVDPLVASRLKAETGGSEFLFLVRGQIVATTLNPRARNIVAERVAGRHGLSRVSDSVTEYAPLETPLLGIGGEQIGELWILRSFEAVRQRLADLRRNLVLIWLAAVFAGFLLTYTLARRIVEPVKALDRAAAEVARNNYEHRVSVASEDELGRLARTFNEMCASIRHSRQELIRQERISTIGRLSSSIVHDLRNPLAAIYGGAEILVDSDLPPGQVKRLAGNIYRASRKIQELLQDLLDVSRGRRMGLEMCRLREVALAGFDPLQAGADMQKVSVEVDVPETIELPLERARIERVFTNLVGNALDVMPSGGRVRISASVEDNAAAVCVEDNGPGILPEIRDRLFQPFVSAGKRNGLGLGLALSRQTVLDHGGDMWVVSEPGRGARFCFKLPLERAGAPAGRVEGTVAAE